VTFRLVALFFNHLRYHVRLGSFAIKEDIRLVFEHVQSCNIISSDFVRKGKCKVVLCLYFVMKTYGGVDV
jgi:hypothetical protein